MHQTNRDLASDRVRRSIMEQSRPLVQAALSLVQAGVRDARGLAEAGLGRAARAGPGPGSRVPVLQKAWAETEARLRELREGLGGSAGLIRFGWENQYRRSWADARALAKLEDLDPDRVEPDRAGIAESRSSKLAGVDLLGFLSGPEFHAMGRLGTAWSWLVKLDHQVDPGPVLAQWEQASAVAMAALTTKAILTGSFRADQMARRDIYVAALLHPDPTRSTHYSNDSLL